MTVAIYQHKRLKGIAVIISIIMCCFTKTVDWIMRTETVTIMTLNNMGIREQDNEPKMKSVAIPQCRLGRQLNILLSFLYIALTTVIEGPLPTGSGLVKVVGYTMNIIPDMASTINIAITYFAKTVSE